MDSSNPSLHDLVKPLLEKWGWFNEHRWTTGITNPIYGKEDSRHSVMVGQTFIYFRGNKLHSSDPQFFEKLEEWLSGP